MSRATRYPPANSSVQWYGNGNATVSPLAILWHTTEGAGGWPAYSGGSMAPNLTYEPWMHQWRQHFPLNGTSRALANGPNYQTNRMGICQVEIACISDPRTPAYATKGIHLLDDQAFQDMHDFSEFMLSEWGIPLVLTTFPFEPVPQSGGSSNRFSPSAFPPFAGHCGHQHAPYNDHGDPGDLDVKRIITSSKDIDTGDDWMSDPQAIAALQAIQENTSEIRRQFGVLLGAIPPGPGENGMTENLSEVRRMFGVALGALEPAGNEQQPLRVTTSA